MFDRAYMRVYEGVNRRLGRLAGGRLARFCRPTWVSLLITERCNARCLHCDIWTNRGQEDAPSPRQWERVLEDLRSWLGPVHVCLTGGEALLREHTVDLVRRGSELGLCIELLTHGYWRDQRRIEEVARANPWRITVSLDGLGEVHDKTRGRSGFFERTANSLETMKRIRRDEGLRYTIRLKTVISQHNLQDLGDLARFADQDGVDIFYQPIENNYNAAADPRWFEQSENWPSDPDEAVRAVEHLIELKREGLPIANSFDQLGAMIPYFRDPDSWQVVTKAHVAEDEKSVCAALGLLQIQSNGDVRVCASMGPVGNIKEAGVREIWEARPAWWKGGCCLESLASPAESERLGLSR